MPGLYRVRVCAVGTEEDMLLLNRTLLENVDEFEIPEDRPPYSLKELHDAVLRYAVYEKGEGSSMVYAMITPHAFGHADKITFDMLRLDDTLYAALFAYECADGFQQEDWLRLHKRCGLLPFFALYAGADYAQPKGEMSFCNGQVTDSWNRMAAAWMYLFEDYEAGLVDEDAVARLKEIEQRLTDTAIDTEDGVAALLTTCRDNLEQCAAGLTVTGAQLRAAVDAHDFPLQLKLQRSVADALLWDCARNARRLACLDYTLESWRNRDQNSLF